MEAEADAGPGPAGRATSRSADRAGERGRRAGALAVGSCDAAGSAALIAYVEAHYDGDAKKNRLCASVPFLQRLADYPRTVMVNMSNQFQWSQDKTLRDWIRASRLDGFSKLMASADRQDADKQAIIARLREQSVAAIGNLPRLMAGQGA